MRSAVSSPAHPPRRRRRHVLVVQVVVALLVGAIGVLAPRPRLVDEAAMATETRRPSAAQSVPSTTVPPEAPATTEAPGDPSPDDPAGAGPATTTSAPEVDPDAPSEPAAPTEPAAPAGPDGPDAGPRVTVTEDTRDFNLIGVTLDDVPTGPVLVRTALDGGGWTPWSELHFHDAPALPPAPGAPVPDEPDEGKPGIHSEPLWVGDASRYELDMPAGASGEAQVHLVYETTRQVAVAETAPAGADPGQPTVHPRSSWGARAPKVRPSIASSLKIGVVHHTAGTNNYSSAQVPALLRGVQAYHMDANGWNDIGYNFAVDRFGRVWEARAGGITNAVIGGHARGFNTGSTGVVMLGNFDTARPSSAAVSAVARILSWKLAVHDADPRSVVAFRAGEGSPRYAPGSVIPLNRVVGHRDVGLTACPGANLWAQLGTIRSRVKSAYPTLAAPGLALVGNFAASGADDVFLRQESVHSDQLLVGSTTGFRSVARYSIQGTAYRPRVGDFDGNGFDDIFWYGPGSVGDSIWLSLGDGRFVSRATSVRGTYSPVVGDFDADGDDDILWYAPGGARDSVWLATGGGRFRHVSTGNVRATFRPVAGDFDGDGDDDIFWHGPGPSVGDSMWVARGGRFTGRATTQVIGRYLPDAGDFDGDGDDDIIWYSPGSQPESVWRFSGLRFSRVTVPAVRGSYPYVRAGDFQGDGRDELLWYRSPGSDAIWWHTSASGLFGRSAATSSPLR